jgi:hypothetical protein
MERVWRLQSIAFGQYSQLLGGRAEELLSQVVIYAALVLIAGFDYRV